MTSFTRLFKTIAIIIIQLWISHSYVDSELLSLVSSDADLDDAKACYKSLSRDGVSIAFGRNAIFSNLPKYLVIKVVAEWVDMDLQSDYDSTIYFMQLSSSKCESTFEFHSPNDFTLMNLKMEFHTGYNTNPFTIIDVNVYPQTKDGLYFFGDVYGALGIYAKYIHGDDTILRRGIQLSFSEFSSKLNTRSFTSKFICAMDQHQMYVIEPIYISTRHSPPSYQAVVFRYYSGISQATMAVVPAWPCDSDPLGSSTNIRLALLGYPTDGRVHFSFESITSFRKPPKDYTLTALKKRISFVTHDIRIIDLDEEDETEMDDHVYFPFDKIVMRSECRQPDTEDYTVYIQNYPVVSYMKIYDGIIKGFKNFKYEAMNKIITC